MEPEGASGSNQVGGRQPVAAALATFFCSAAIGAVAARRWRRAVFWWLSDWAWYVFMVGGVHFAAPRAMWAGIVGFWLWRIPAAVDAFRLVRGTRALVSWPTLVRVWLVLSLGAFVVTAGTRRFLVEAFKIPSGGMAPTLMIGDHIMVDKSARQAQPGDVIVFEFPLDRETIYVKRVVAVGGDALEIDDGKLIVNGKDVWRERVQNGCAGEPDERPDEPCVIWEETLGERRYQTGYDKFGGPRYTDRRVVKPGHVFVLGDNRDNSSDSRVWGDVPLENVKGTVRFIWWSPSWDRVSQVLR